MEPLLNGACTCYRRAPSVCSRLIELAIIEQCALSMGGCTHELIWTCYKVCDHKLVLQQVINMAIGWMNGGCGALTLSCTSHDMRYTVASKHINQ